MSTNGTPSPVQSSASSNGGEAVLIVDGRPSEALLLEYQPIPTP